MKYLNKVITTHDISTRILQAATVRDEELLERVLEEREIRMVRKLRDCHYNMSRIAHEIGKSRDTIEQNLKGICFALLDEYHLDLHYVSKLLANKDHDQKKIEQKMSQYLHVLKRQIDRYGRKKPEKIILHYRKVSNKFYPHIISVIQKITSKS